MNFGEFWWVLIKSNQFWWISINSDKSKEFRLWIFMKSVELQKVWLISSNFHEGVWKLCFVTSLRRTAFVMELYLHVHMCLKHFRWLKHHNTTEINHKPYTCSIYNMRYSLFKFNRRFKVTSELLGSDSNPSFYDKSERILLLLKLSMKNCTRLDSKDEPTGWYFKNIL